MDGSDWRICARRKIQRGTWVIREDGNGRA
uniref:Uncharacterized protein n=1 Tax=Arundo donax TaxID=35708 RepID=A0A0A8YV14_ARUDO